MCNITNANIDKVRMLAKKQGITLKFLCDCLGKRSSFLNEVRFGKDHIDTNELTIIADKLHTTVEYLTDQTDDPARPEEKEKPDAITDAEQAEFDARFMKLSPERQEWVLKFLDLAIAEQEKEKRERKENHQNNPKRPE